MPKIIFYLLYFLTISIPTLIFIIINEIDCKDYLAPMFFIAFASYYFFLYSLLIVVAVLHRFQLPFFPLIKTGNSLKVSLLFISMNINIGK